MTSLPRVLGIDPGLNTTGYGILEVAVGGPKVCEAGVIRGRTRGSMPHRLAEIHADLVDLIAAMRPSVMAVEQLYSHYKRPRTAILMGHARGVICLAATQASIPVSSYASTRVKKTLTGHGRATKVQMQKAVQKELRLPRVPEPNDVSDALAVALCHYYAQPEWVALARAARAKP
ncbi:MAG TPA: crossover junction endodeoxyribonuclease RuvC [Pirellulales bacterium]|nr:crossover junction endodeoxyribonuclease RuvC [Pirellulales bacterium]